MSFAENAEMISILRYIVDIFNKESNNLNALYYLWRRNKWMLNPKAYLDYYVNVPIKNPIFLIGNQGAGLTLLSRILRRNPRVVNVTGDCHYWAGADEMMSICEPILTRELSGMFLNPPKHEVYTPPRSWSYASNDLIEEYRKTKQDADHYQRRKLRNAIGLAVKEHGKSIKNPVFIDKSQVFSVKMSFINALLSDSNPFFIHMTRNPYASIYRAAIGKAKDMLRYARLLSLEERIQVCTEHWYNVIQSIEEDKGEIRNYRHIRFEELLTKPEEVVTELCRYLGLEFCDDMVPQPHHRLPLGTRFRGRWYPLRKEVNKKYIQAIDPINIDRVASQCGDIAGKYGYKPPSQIK